MVLGKQQSLSLGVKHYNLLPQSLVQHVVVMLLVFVSFVVGQLGTLAMTATYQIGPDELEHFIDTLRKSFGGNTLKITIEEIDETAYLLSDPARAKRLETAAKNVRTNQNTISLTFSQLQELEQRASI